MPKPKYPYLAGTVFGCDECGKTHKAYIHLTSAPIHRCGEGATASRKRMKVRKAVAK